MTPLFRPLLFVSSIILFTALTGRAQQLAVVSDRLPATESAELTTREGYPRPKLNDPVSNSLTERRGVLSSLQKRIEALSKYLLSVSPGSRDYHVTEQAIQTLAAKLQVMTSEMGSATSSPAAMVGNGASGPPPSRPAAAQQFVSFSDYINSRIPEILKANTDQKSNANQTETPSVSENSTSLVDQSSGPDLINLAVNLAGASTGLTSSKNITPATVTASLYSIASALKGYDPLNPYYYNMNRDLRRVWFTLGYEKGEQGQSGMEGESAVLAGVKFLLIHRRDASYHPDEVNDLFIALQNASWDVGRIADQVNLELFNDKRVRDKVIAARYKTFLEKRIAVVSAQIDAGAGNPAANAAALAAYQQDLAVINALPLGSRIPPGFFAGDPNAKNPTTGKSNWSRAQLEFFTEFRNTGWKDALDIVGPAILDDKIEKNIASFMKLTSASQETFEKIRRAPQLSLAAQTKRRREGIDEYEGKLIFDYGLMNRMDLTLNGTFNYMDSRMVGDHRGGSFSGQLKLQVNPEGNLVDPNMLLNLYLGGEGKWLTGMKPSYKVQGKVKVTLWDGVDLPFSVTYSNRTELIEESDVRGQFGFSFDTSKLLRLFKFKGMPLPANQSAPAATPTGPTP